MVPPLEERSFYTCFTSYSTLSLLRSKFIAALTFSCQGQETLCRGCLIEHLNVQDDRRCPMRPRFGQIGDLPVVMPGWPAAVTRVMRWLHNCCWVGDHPNPPWYIYQPTSKLITKPILETAQMLGDVSVFPHVIWWPIYTCRMSSVQWPYRHITESEQPVSTIPYHSHIFFARKGNCNARRWHLKVVPSKKKALSTTM